MNHQSRVRLSGHIYDTVSFGHLSHKKMHIPRQEKTPNRTPGSSRKRKSSESHEPLWSILRRTRLGNLAKRFKGMSYPNKNMGRREATNVRTYQHTKAASKHKGKSTAFRRKKIVKVNHKFKLKVEKALEPEKLHGTWKQHSFSVIPENVFTTNSQYVNGLGALSQDYSAWAFDMENAIHAVSVMWNNKTDSQGTRVWNVGSTLGICPAPLGAGFIDNQALPTNNSTLNTLTALSWKLSIKNSYEIYKLKNNTQRTVYIQVYLCSPKSTAAKDNPDTFMNTSAVIPGTTAVADNVNAPHVLWGGACEDLASQGVNIMYSKPTTLYESPKRNMLFNKFFKSDVTYVTLEPGQVYNYKIQGPSDKVINLETLFRANATGLPYLYMGIQKFMRYPMFTAYLDQVTDGTLGGRYAPTAALANTEGINIERTMYWSFHCPENVGAHLAANAPTGGNSADIELNNRRSVYAHVVYTPITATGTLERVDVENPTVKIPE